MPKRLHKIGCISQPGALRGNCFSWSSPTPLHTSWWNSIISWEPGWEERTAEYTFGRDCVWKTLWKTVFILRTEDTGSRIHSLLCKCVCIAQQQVPWWANFALNSGESGWAWLIYNLQEGTSIYPGPLVVPVGGMFERGFQAKQSNHTPGDWCLCHRPDLVMRRILWDMNYLPGKIHDTVGVGFVFILVAGSVNCRVTERSFSLPGTWY